MILGLLSLSSKGVELPKSPRLSALLPAELQTQAAAYRPARPFAPSSPLTDHPWLTVPTPAFPPLEFQFFPSTQGSERGFCLLWDKKLAYEPNKKEPNCMLLVPHATSTRSRPQYRIHCVQQAGPRCLSHTWTWVVSPATRMMSSVLLNA